MARKILFVVNGFGMGNATRCHALIQFLRRRNFEIHVLTSDRAYSYFQNVAEIKTLHRQTDISMKSNFRYGTLIFFASYLPFFLKRMFANFRIQRNLFRQFTFDDVIFDSDYSFVFHRIVGAEPRLIGLNNSIEVIKFFSSRYREIKLNLLPSLLMEGLDCLVHRLFTVCTLCPALNFNLLSGAAPRTGRFYFYPTIVRQELFTSTRSDDGSVLVMATSSNVESNLTMLQSHVKAHTCNSLIKNFTSNNSELLMQAKLVLCNSGQSSLSECLYLKKRCVTVPIARHAEQYANARLVERAGVLVYRDQDPDKILQQAYIMTPPEPLISREAAEAELNSVIDRIFPK